MKNLLLSLTSLPKVLVDIIDFYVQQITLGMNYDKCLEGIENGDYDLKSDLNFLLTHHHPLYDVIQNDIIFWWLIENISEDWFFTFNGIPFIVFGDGAVGPIRGINCRILAFFLYDNGDVYARVYRSSFPFIAFMPAMLFKRSELIQSRFMLNYFKLYG